jgi:hypothetical protein
MRGLSVLWPKRGQLGQETTREWREQWTFGSPAAELASTDILLMQIVRLRREYHRQLSKPVRERQPAIL